MSLQGSRILIIGGGSGIGYAVAEAAIGNGAEVAIASTDAARLARSGECLGGVALHVLDVTDEGRLAAFFAGARRFDHIVSTAGG